MKKYTPFIVTTVFILLMLFPFSAVPPLGTFLNYSTGFMQIKSPELSQKKMKQIKHSEYKGEIAIDSLGIPHIYSEDDNSAAFMLGYMHSRDRFFQMELIIRMVQGKLAELVGKKALTSDIFWRNFQFETKAKRIYSKLTDEPKIKTRVDAYADGVRYYQDHSSLSDKPEEYHLLGSEPFEWKNYYSLLLIKYMSNTLSNNKNDIFFQEVKDNLPEEIIAMFYPLQEDYLQTTIPEKTGIKKSSTNDIVKQKRTNSFGSLSPKEKFHIGLQEVIGSNNWVVSGSKSATGKAMLANDMHLGLTLPGPWYEVQLHTKNKHVYGLTIPCSPYIVAGFNQAISWGLTNATWDLTDYYTINYANENQTRYLHGAETKPITSVPEIIKIKGSDDYLHTVRNTELGPIIAIKEREYIMHWTASAETNEAKTFHFLETAANWQDFQSAIQHFQSPPQNFVYADTAGNIGTYTPGIMIKKNPRFERGVYSTSEALALPTKTIPFEELPHIYNPEKGFIATANQRQLYNSENYYNWSMFAPPFRGYRISEQLRNKEYIDITDMKALHADINDRSKDWLIPLLEKNSFKKYQGLVQKLSEWDGEMSIHRFEPTILEEFKEQLIREFEFLVTKGNPKLLGPHSWVILNHLKNYEQYRIHENLIDYKTIAKKAFLKTMEILTDEFGTDHTQWTFSKYHQSSIKHLLHLPAFSPEPFPVGGSNFTVNVAKGRNVTHGASQRSVIQMSTPVEAYFNIAGGQSGRPSSPFYQNQLETWKHAGYHKVQHPKNSSELTGIIATIRFGD